MTDSINSIVNKGLEALTHLAPRNVVSAIKDAASETGVDFAYLLQQAGAESSFDADAKASTSSASGLFQFIESTWMDMVDRFGDKYGIDKTAAKSDILELRNDPDIASKMAAEFAGQNKAHLERTFDGDIGATELYFAHFMGAGGGSAFLNAHQENPGAQAAAIFPKAAAANQNVFYDRATGRAKTLDEVYAFFDKKFQIEGTEAPAGLTRLAEATITPPEQITAAATTPYTSPAAAIRSTSQTNSLTPSSYQSLFANPIDMILLTQLDLPGVKTSSNTYF